MHCPCRYEREAVSVRLGGIASKLPAWRQPQRPWLLAVEDPQVATSIQFRKWHCLISSHTRCDVVCLVGPARSEMSVASMLGVFGEQCLL